MKRFAQRRGLGLAAALLLAGCCTEGTPEKPDWLAAEAFWVGSPCTSGGWVQVEAALPNDTLLISVYTQAGTMLQQAKHLPSCEALPLAELPARITGLDNHVLRYDSHDGVSEGCGYHVVQFIELPGVERELWESEATGNN